MSRRLLRPAAKFGRSAFALSMMALFGLACADGGTVDGEGGAGAASATTGTAPDCAGLTACGQACADLSSDPENCGACGKSCVIPHGAPACVQGECAVLTCSAGFANCDNNDETGCESAIACTEGAACMTSCATQGATSCADACAPSCTLPAESCNAIDDDCNGTCDEGALAGCRVGVHRAYNGTKGHLFTTDLAEATAWGLEFENFFYLYQAPAADLRPFFRCPKAGNPNYFYSDSNDCEMTAAPLLTVGFIAPAPMAGAQPSCGAEPLYRLSLGANGWHFYTTSAAERDSAVAGGWLSEGIAGYIWKTP